MQPTQNFPRLHSLPPILAVFLFLLPHALCAQDIDGVQPAAIDQPRINLLLRRQPNGPPLTTNASGQSTFNIESFLDTGAGSILISTSTADQLGVQHELAPAANRAQIAQNKPQPVAANKSQPGGAQLGKAGIAGAGTTEVRFNDIGVGGESQFAVSEPLILSIAPETPNADIDNKDSINTVYNQTVGPFRTDIGPLGIMNGLMAMLTGDMDVTGMPAMQGKIAVMDCRDVNAMTDKIRTTLYDAKTPAVSLSNPPASSPIPKTSHHIQLSYANFQRFTTTTPATAQGPAVAANPFIGPNPLEVLAISNKTPGVANKPPNAIRIPPLTVTHHGKSSSGSWLLDTGAVASMISLHQAAAIGVTYAPGSQSTGSPLLLGVPADQQFTLQVGGIGGMANSAGFYIDKLILPTREGPPITYLHAPVLVADITVTDPASGKPFTLDGVFGMNFLVASANISGGLLPDITKMTAGPFRWIVFDQPAGVLGLE